MSIVNCSTPGCVFIDQHEGPCSNGVPVERHNTRDIACRRREGNDIVDANAHCRVCRPHAYPDHPSGEDFLTAMLWAGSGGTVYATEQAYDICERLIPEWKALFIQKNAKYRAVGTSLGARGVFPDINRKTGVLKDRIWDGGEVIGEPTREVIMDLVGHLFLMLQMLDAEESSN